MERVDIDGLGYEENLREDLGGIRTRFEHSASNLTKNIMSHREQTKELIAFTTRIAEGESLRLDNWSEEGKDPRKQADCL